MTLTEVMATLAIAAVTASMAVPAMTGMMADNQRSTALNEFVHALHSARSQAITRNEQVTVCPSRTADECEEAEWHEGLIWFLDQDKDQQLSSADTLLGTLKPYDDGLILSKEFDAFVTYQPNGKIRASSGPGLAGEWLICDLMNPQDSRVLTLSAAGKPRLVEGLSQEHFADCERP